MSAITIFITTGSGPNQEHLKKKNKSRKPDVKVTVTDAVLIKLS